ncbi:MAG: hypothetical protein F4060_16460 [Holophagales bacterium]|nr:hypothetical protein [Holophagales bacterium]MYG30471.1 hypothetical protein [Holophagales bacterium]MYI81517.1 hypothetical protein [Holophagales bacterium]
MTSLCPDWAALLRERERAERTPEVGGATVDAAWNEALRHREDCERCRAASLDADPVLLFSGPPAGDTADHDDEVSAGDIDAIRQRVRLELDGRATERRLNEARSARRRLPVASVLAAGAAAAALGLSFLLWPKTAPPAEEIADVPPVLPDHIAMAPLVEPLGDEPLQVYQLPGNDSDGLDVVLVVAP